MKVYVAGSTKEVPRVQRVQQAVRDASLEIAFDWTGAEGMIRTQDQPWDEVHDHGVRISCREIEACFTAGLTIVLCPPLGQGLGCWIELGAALAGYGLVWVVKPPRDSVFWHHPKVTRFASDEELLSQLIRRT